MDKLARIFRFSAVVDDLWIVAQLVFIDGRGLGNDGIVVLCLRESGPVALVVRLSLVDLVSGGDVVIYGLSAVHFNGLCLLCNKSR